MILPTSKFETFLHLEAGDMACIQDRLERWAGLRNRISEALVMVNRRRITIEEEKNKREDEIRKELRQAKLEGDKTLTSEEAIKERVKYHPDLLEFSKEDAKLKGDEFAFKSRLSTLEGFRECLRLLNNNARSDGYS